MGEGPGSSVKIIYFLLITQLYEYIEFFLAAVIWGQQLLVRLWDLPGGQVGRSSGAVNNQAV